MQSAIPDELLKEASKGSGSAILDEAMSFIAGDIAALNRRYETAVTDEDRIDIDHDREVYRYILNVLYGKAMLGRF